MVIQEAQTMIHWMENRFSCSFDCRCGYRRQCASEVLSRLSMFLMDETFKEHRYMQKASKNFLKYIDEGRKCKGRTRTEKEQEKHKSRGYDVLAVTACLTGIAHTYMAAESPENTAKRDGCGINAETNGSGGIKCSDWAEEIAQ